MTLSVMIQTHVRATPAKNERHDRGPRGEERRRHVDMKCSPPNEFGEADGRFDDAAAQELVTEQEEMQKLFKHPDRKQTKTGTLVML